MKDNTVTLAERLVDLKEFMNRTPEGFKAVREIEKQGKSAKEQFELLRELINRVNRESKIDELLNNS